MPQNILGTARVQVDFPALPEKTDERIKGFPEGFFFAERSRPFPTVKYENNIAERKTILKTVAAPERRRSELEISVLPVVRFVPFDKGTAFAGANCRG